MMSTSVRPLFALLTVQLRNLSVSPALAAKVTSSRADPKLKELRSDLKKHKETLKKLKERHSAQVAKQKERTTLRKKQEKAKKEVAEALKTKRKVNGLNVYVKEKTQSGEKLAAASKNYSLLVDSEKEVWEKKAAEINARNAELYTLPPTRPANAYASYIRDNWYQDDLEFTEVTKILAQRWKELSKEEKASYEPTQEAKDQYAKEYEKWQDYRIKLHQSEKEKAKSSA